MSRCMFAVEEVMITTIYIRCSATMLALDGHGHLIEDVVAQLVLKGHCVGSMCNVAR